VTSWHCVTTSPGETRQLGELLGRFCRKSAVVLLEGDLGSGKTCFVQGVALGIGVQSGEPVHSPTYTLMNRYHGRCDVYHFDLYRLGDADELIELDFDSYLHGEGVTLVEWAALVDRKDIGGVEVSLEYGPAETERRFHFKALGDAGENLIAELARTWKGN